MSEALSGKNVLVTGSSRGIGRAIAQRLAKDGAAVIVHYVRNAKAAEEVVGTLLEEGSKAVAIQADLAQPSQVRRLFDEAEQAIGPLDIVFANAADALVKPLIECTEEDFERIFALNVKGVFFTLQQAAQRVRNGGRIIATSTGGTKMFFTQTSLYLGSKGAVEQFVRVLSREVGDRNITVNVLSPGFTDTELLPERDRAVGASMSPFNRLGSVEEVAEVAAFLASDNARWVTGQNLAAGGGVF
jgi:3-oxoacyl-[acyl-carrier protein] reductase